MEEVMLGEIKMFGGNYQPRGWAFCNGQPLAIQQYQSLYAILGTTYGGDGRTTFGLPDLRGRTPKHWGHAPGLREYQLGERGGRNEHTLSQIELPSHNHQMQLFAENKPADSDNAERKMLAHTQTPAYASPGGNTTQLAGDAITSEHTGGSQAFSIENPYQTVSYIIALEGIFPSRS